MLQKVATVLFVVIQVLFIACALIVVTAESSVAPTTLVGVATFSVAYYTLSTSSWRLLNTVFCQKTPDKKGVLDL